MGYILYRLRLKTAYKGVHGARRGIYGLAVAAFYFFLVNSEKKDLTRTAKSSIIYKNGQIAPLCVIKCSPTGQYSIILFIGELCPKIKTKRLFRNKRFGNRALKNARNG